MKLAEFLQKHPDETVHIGAASGFVYIGPGKDFNVEKADGIYRDKIRKRIDEAREMLRSVTMGLEDIPDLPEPPGLDESTSDVWDSFSFSMRRARTLLLQKVSVAMTAIRDMRDYAEKLVGFVSFAEREVLDTYPRIQEDGIVCVIEGHELGPLWTGIETEDGYTFKPRRAPNGKKR